MSLARTALRFCVLEALRPTAQLSAQTPVWPTLAGAMVFDSRLDPIEDLAEAERRPVVVVYTEDQNLDKFGQHGPIFYKSFVDLVFELSVIARGDDGADYEPGLAYSDAELEADLDLLEEQIFWVLHFGPSAALFRNVGKLPFEDWRSTPHRSPEEGFRLAMRTVRLRVWLKESCYDGSPAAAPQGLERLPEPLKSVVQSLAQTHYGYAIGLGLAAKAPVAATAVPLGDVALDVELTDLASADEGVAAVNAVISIESALAIPMVTATGGPIEIDYARGAYVEMLLTANVPALSVINWPPPGRVGRLVLSVINTGAFSIAANAWPAGTRWPAGVAPATTQGAGKRDLVILMTADGGATIDANPVGFDYRS